MVFNRMALACVIFLAIALRARAEVCQVGLHSPKTQDGWEQPIKHGARIEPCAAFQCSGKRLYCILKRGEIPLIDFEGKEGASHCLDTAARLEPYVDDPFRTIIHYKANAFSAPSWESIDLAQYFGCRLKAAKEDEKLYLATCEDLKAALTVAEKSQTEKKGFSRLKELGCVRGLSGRKGYAIFNIPGLHSPAWTPKGEGSPDYGDLPGMLDAPAPRAPASKKK